MLRKASSAVAGIVLLTVIGVAAAGAGELSHPCAAVEDSLERLACYDDAFPRSAAAVPEQAAEALAAEAPVSAAAEAPELVEEFGLTEAQLQARDPERAREPRVERVEATVVSIRHRSSGERVVTLDNGQVWLQTEVTVRGPLSPGDTVLIRRAAFGSFQIVTPGRVALRVRRIE